LKIRRGGEWHTVGVFDLSGEEWAELAPFCVRLGIEVRDESQERSGG
jgi:hypothetical protein